MVESSHSVVAQLRERKPVVLIVTDDIASSAAISEELGRCGYDTRISTYNGRTLKDAPRRAPKAVLMYFNNYLQAAPKILTILRERYDGHDLTFIGAFSQKGIIDAALFDSVVFPPAHPPQIARRVNSMMRLQTMQREIMLRMDTLREDFGIEYIFSEDALHSPFRILFIGKASPEFMVVINALEDRNVEVIAAFTSFSAFDFLHENPFDAVVISMVGGPEPGMTICETMRRNSKLYNTPTLMLVGDDFEDADLAYKKGATDLIPSRASQEEISGRIVELANGYRIQQRLKAEFGAIGGERSTDAATGVYNSAFFAAHLRRIYAADIAACEPTSVMLLQFKPKTPETIEPQRLKAAFDQAGRMIKNMVRMEDIVARISDESYAVAFPGQSPDKIETVTERISAIIHEAGFQGGNRAYETFHLSVNIALAGSVSGEDSAAIMTRLDGMMAETPYIRHAG